MVGIEGLKMPEIMTEPFYVYVYLDPRKPGIYKYGDITFKYEPFYVGKGGGGDHGRYRRYKDHLKKALNGNTLNNTFKFYKIRNIIESGQKPIIKILRYFRIEKEALEGEVHFIELIGRKDKGKGPLTNLTNGGDGVINLSKVSRKKISESLKGNIPWNRRKKCSEEQKKMISEKIININKAKVKKVKDDNRPIYNPVEKEERVYKFSKAQRKKLSKSCMGRIPWNKGLKNAQRAWNKGMKLPPGKRHTEEDLIKMRKNKKGKIVGQYTLEGVLMNIFQSQRDAARLTGLRREGIRDCCSGKQLSAYGFEWRVLEKEIV